MSNYASRRITLKMVLILEDIGFSPLNGTEVDIIIGNDVPKAHWCRNNAYVNRTLLEKNSLPDE